MCVSLLPVELFGRLLSLSIWCVLALVFGGRSPPFFSLSSGFESGEGMEGEKEEEEEKS